MDSGTIIAVGVAIIGIIAAGAFTFLGHLLTIRSQENKVIYPNEGYIPSQESNQTEGITADPFNPELSAASPGLENPATDGGFANLDEEVKKEMERRYPGIIKKMAHITNNFDPDFNADKDRSMDS